MENLDVLAVTDSVTFGHWRYERRARRLLRCDGHAGWVPAPLGSRAADILAALLREPGALVSKDALMDVVWPGVAVEANNLTVQIAALRRVLDDGASGPSCIQTIPGRGYRLLCNPEEPATPVSPPALPPTPASRRHPAVRFAIPAMALLAIITFISWPSRVPSLPRMSTLITPFENLGAPDDAKIAASLTDDLKSDLAMTSLVRVVDSRALHLSDDRGTPLEVLGRKLGARYVVRGSERRLGDVLRVNAQIFATESETVLWTDRFDVSLSDPAAGQKQAVEFLHRGVVRALVPLEAARGQSERPDTPDALDLSLRAQSLELSPPTPSRSTEIRVLSERALQLEPNSALYRLLLVRALLDEEDENPHGRKAVYERTASLLAEALAIKPALWLGMSQKLYWFYWQGERRCPEVVDLAGQFLGRYSNLEASNVMRWLASCQIVSGHADTAVSVMEHALTLEPTAYRSHDYRNLAFALLLLGRYEESIQAGERALSENPEDAVWERARLNRYLASAYALTSRLPEARSRLAEAIRMDPFATLRRPSAPGNASPVFAAQLARHKEGLRLAGLRDHAEEDADFRVAAESRLHQRFSGYTPLSVPGAVTIRTDALVPLVADRRIIIIDALNNFAGASLPGAVGLRYVGDGGTLTDLAQDRLRIAMRDLTKGRLDAPIVAVGWNSESFDGPNLALRLVALGYTHVFWYRGGREAWEVRGQQEDNLSPYDW